MDAEACFQNLLTLRKVKYHVLDGREAFQIVLKVYVPKMASFLGGRYAPSPKNTTKIEKLCNAGLLFHSYTDFEKSIYVHIAADIRRNRIRTPFPKVVIFKFRIYTKDPPKSHLKAPDDSQGISLLNGNVESA